MGDVHDHPELIHPLHCLYPKVCKTFFHNTFVTAVWISDTILVVPCQSNKADTVFIQIIQPGKACRLGRRLLLL